MDDLQAADIIFGDLRIVAKHLHHATNLKFLQSTFAGVEPVFLHSTRPRDYVFCRMGRGLNEGMAEWVMMNTLAHYRKLPMILDAQKTSDWSFAEASQYSLLKGKTMTILGAGTIG